ncbi:MAG: DNA mismatch repair protein [Promethearchaeota archaeon CR_4]|nr:MAG: DNA mismatch repair protein [Candidatus Lokiarchaeota archaeon CR_4]
MPKIQKIEHAERIAAGEVVERPTSVVKELLENSIDAGSKNITISLKQGGKESIQVIDDGCGIPADEVALAFQKHFSSKIRSADDLEHLTTLGFRGEALGSIATVARVLIITKVRDSETGYKIAIEGGQIYSEGQTGAPDGTNITVKNLFFNIPARRKFLKTDSVELAHCTDIVVRYALAYPSVRIKYTHNDQAILHTPGTNSLVDTVGTCYDSQTARQVFPFEYANSGLSIKIQGILGAPTIARPSRQAASLFVNQRYVQVKKIAEAVESAYHSLVMVNRFPFYVLFLEVPPDAIDVNIHPRKQVIRIAHEEEITESLRGAIRDALTQHTFIPGKEVRAVEVPLQVPGMPLLRLETTSPTSSLRSIDGRSPDAISAICPPQIDKSSTQTTLNLSARKDGKMSTVHLSQTIDQMPEGWFQVGKLPKWRPINAQNQVHDTYVLFEGEDGLYIVDQHAIAERARYEALQAELATHNKISSQQLLIPIKIDLSPAESDFLQKNILALKRYGVTLDFFGGTTFLLRRLPVIFGNLEQVSFIKDTIRSLVDLGMQTPLDEARDAVLKKLACHGSIRAGEPLKKAQILKLVKDVAACELPFNCCHGRPSIIILSFEELEKRFKRIV